MRFYKLAANGFMAFLDFGIGALLVSLMSILLNHEIQWWQCFIGGILGLVPDFDVIWMFLNRGKVYGNHHEFITHRPVFGIGVAALTSYFIGGSFWMVTALVCVGWHYVHDTEGFGGGGIAWLWPISGQYVSLSGFKDPSRSIMVESGEKHDEYLDAIYLRPTRRSVAELGIGSLAVGSAAAIIAVSWWGLMLTLIPAVAVVAIWATYRHQKPTR